MRFVAFLAIVIVFGVAKFAGQSPRREAQSLEVRQEAGRTVFVWNGPVAPPMRERFEAAFAKLGSEPRRVLISFNSPGGSVQHGHEVIQLLHQAARLHYIDTIVEQGRMCASMCVPLYLVGQERLASPQARFMFHEVILKLKPEGEAALRKLKQISQAEAVVAKRQAVSHFTDKLFEDEFAKKLNDHWLQAMRQRIKGRDVWLSGRQLIDEHSGVVDKLI